MRYRLRTLLILLAILPPLLWFGWTKYEAWRAEQERQRAIRATSQQQSQLQIIDEPILGTTSDLSPVSELEWKEWVRRRAEQQKIQRNRP